MVINNNLFSKVNNAYFKKLCPIENSVNAYSLLFNNSKQYKKFDHILSTLPIITQLFHKIVFIIYTKLMK